MYDPHSEDDLWSNWEEKDIVWHYLMNRSASLKTEYLQETFIMNCIWLGLVELKKENKKCSLTETYEFWTYDCFEKDYFDVQQAVKILTCFVGEWFKETEELAAEYCYAVYEEPLHSLDDREIIKFDIKNIQRTRFINKKF